MQRMGLLRACVRCVAYVLVDHPRAEVLFAKKGLQLLLHTLDDNVGRARPVAALILEKTSTGPYCCRTACSPTAHLERADPRREPQLAHSPTHVRASKAPGQRGRRALRPRARPGCSGALRAAAPAGAAEHGHAERRRAAAARHVRHPWLPLDELDRAVAGERAHRRLGGG